MGVLEVGNGKKVGGCQFVKGGMTTGKKPVLDACTEQVEFKPMGDGFTWDTQDRARDISMARRAWEEVKRMIADPGYDMLVADELNIVLRYDYLPLDEVVEIGRAHV